jgi:hypothetical protein
MSTRAEQKRYDDERKHPSKRQASTKKRSSRSGEPGPHLNARAAKKAVFAADKPAADGRRSRKSTRTSAHHARSDHGLLTKESIVGRAPTAVARRAKRPAGRV